MKENLDASKIELDQSILDKVSSLNIDKRYNDPGIFVKTPLILSFQFMIDQTFLQI